MAPCKPRSERGNHVDNCHYLCGRRQSVFFFFLHSNSNLDFEYFCICGNFNLLLAGMTCHARREFFVSKIVIFPQSQVYSSKTKRAIQIINLLLLNNFYPVITYRRVQKESGRVVVYGLGHSLWSAISCQRKWFNCPRKRSKASL